MNKNEIRIKEHYLSIFRDVYDMDSDDLQYWQNNLDSISLEEFENKLNKLKKNKLNQLKERNQNQGDDIIFDLDISDEEKNPNSFWIIKGLPKPKKFKATTSRKWGVIVVLAWAFAMLCVLLMFLSLAFWVKK
ncbi:hypothetical protein C4M96_02600 [Mycoplasmopsis pullorum]|uniref:hypothetical protein n=1 Tax=Mycoplasmopsis pullorum TaxID=48003 RepID=UPI001119D2EE|nr:hypothetical protein [Mycoplasmopsis pullorum]TNK91987.1 hypothetical protein C4M96_02600 [Mycoplasmopsis pullorum]